MSPSTIALRLSHSTVLLLSRPLSYFSIESNGTFTQSQTSGCSDDGVFFLFSLKSEFHPDKIERIERSAIGSEGS